VHQQRVADLEASGDVCGDVWHGGGDAGAFLLIPITRAITLICIPPARCSRRISGQSSTDNTRFLPARLEPGLVEGVSFRATRGQFSADGDTSEISDEAWVTLKHWPTARSRWATPCLPRCVRECWSARSERCRLRRIPSRHLRQCCPRCRCALLLTCRSRIRLLELEGRTV